MTMNHCVRCNAPLNAENGIFEDKADAAVRVCPTCALELTILKAFDRVAD
jgi:hypothetical protein